MSKKAVVTAGTAGLGYEIARGLAGAGYAVTLVARDPARGQEAAERLGARFVAADLSSLAEVRRLAGRLAADGPLDLLVNNAGGMWVDRWETTDGIEGSFALNHLTPYMLTTTVPMADPSRIVQVTSSAMMAATPVFAEVDLPGEYYGLAVTGRAKLANLAWSLDVAGDLHRRGITLVLADPGPAATPNAAAMAERMLPPAMRPMWSSIQEGVKRPVTEAAAAVIRAATAEAGPGTIFGPTGEPDDSLRAHVTPEITAAVRKLTAAVL
ncbi:SDR family NAD(P)-dependent oxidoreductase [Actinoplanes sp. LDG1-06]|uniref:SDR family NAD(P)-dependent oxidoreductase n=1 Tax=Paractinoplanes ovalisporus TaxID=2810368 RepID=A0ABS2AEC3_9ACTN|nr:SDR family NAD(P)-dependent oxidoreductase [Actinoplanes ovalisporus]MBM2618191.1 SDR family NAD(P)-dependent oxidoreductase [Actinoplanes ovalisporus]